MRILWTIKWVTLISTINLPPIVPLHLKTPSYCNVVTWRAANCRSRFGAQHSLLCSWSNLSTELQTAGLVVCHTAVLKHVIKRFLVGQWKQSSVRKPPLTALLKRSYLHRTHHRQFSAWRTLGRLEIHYATIIQRHVLVNSIMLSVTHCSVLYCACIVISSAFCPMSKKTMNEWMNELLAWFYTLGIIMPPPPRPDGVRRARQSLSRLLRLETFFCFVKPIGHWDL